MAEGSCGISDQEVEPEGIDMRTICPICEMKIELGDLTAAEIRCPHSSDKIVSGEIENLETSKIYFISSYSQTSMSEKMDEEDGFFNSIAGKLFLFFTPFLIAGLFIYLLYIIIYDKGVFWLVGSAMFAYFFPPAGKESVIPLLVGELNRRNAFSPTAIITLVGGSIAFIDVITSYFLLWNFYIAESIPFLGEWIKRFEKFGAQKMKEKTWISKVAFVGVAFFVVFPFQGSGGVGGSILGKVIGMDKYHAWIAIIIGAFSGCFFISYVSYYLSGAIIDAFKSGLFKGIGVLILVIVVFIFLYYFFKHNKSKLLI